MLEGMPDRQQTAAINSLLGCVTPLVASRIVLGMDLVHLSVGRTWTRNTLIKIYAVHFPVLLLVVIIVIVFHPQTVSEA